MLRLLGWLSMSRQLDLWLEMAIMMQNSLPFNVELEE